MTKVGGTFAPIISEYVLEAGALTVVLMLNPNRFDVDEFTVAKLAQLATVNELLNCAFETRA